MLTCFALLSRHLDGVAASAASEVGSDGGTDGIMDWGSSPAVLALLEEDTRMREERDGLIRDKERLQAMRELLAAF